MSTEILSPTSQQFKDANSSATTAKLFYVMNGMVVMALNDADAAADNIFIYEAERVRVPKASGAWTAGDEIYFDSGNSNFTTTKSGNAFAGYAVEDEASGDTEGEIHLTPHKIDRNVPYDATFTLDTESSNEITVSVQLKDKVGADLTARAAVMAYLSSDANGDALEAVSATLTIAAGTDGIVAPAAAANATGHSLMLLVSEADGDVDVSITQTSGADTFYLVLVMPDGRLVVSGAITFAA